MSQIHAELERPIAAPAEQVFGYFADYRVHHPRLLPPAFSDLQIEEGGVGAGTVVNFKFTLGGQTQSFRMRVAEPVPGRVLTESTFDGSATTIFTITPDGDGCRVKLETTFEGSRGVVGFLQRLIAPRMMARVYAEELAILDRYARERVGTGRQSTVGAAIS